MGFQYVITSTGTPRSAPYAATASTVASTSLVRRPPASATSVARWTVTPSITGSLYGRPISITSAPPSTNAFRPSTPPA
jgi:hypothetical protein